MKAGTKPTVKTTATVRTKATVKTRAMVGTVLKPDGAPELNGVPGMNAVPDADTENVAGSLCDAAKGGHHSRFAVAPGGAAASAGSVYFEAALSHVMAPRMEKDDDEPNDGDTGTVVVTKTKPKTKRPNMYRVLLLNDDYTPMEFVVHVLERFFQKNLEDATRIMLHVHHHGVGECGVFTYEVAETKVTQVMDFARKHQHPLQCVMEKK